MRPFGFALAERILILARSAKEHLARVANEIRPTKEEEAGDKAGLKTR